MSCFVVDLGGTNLRCAITSDSDEVLCYERTRLDEHLPSRGEAIWETITEAVASFVDAHTSNVSADTPIAFAFPGPVRGDRAVGQAPTVAGAAAVPDVCSMLRLRTGRDVMMLNDVSAAAWYFQNRLPLERFGVVTVSSGIGSKIFDRRSDGGVLDDPSYAGEIGHLVVDTGDDAPWCDCGGRGHLGAVASGRGFERRARREAQRDEQAFRASACVRTFGATTSSLNNEQHLVPAIAAGDPWSMSLLRASVAPLADVLRVLTIGCGLQGVVVMGGFAQHVGAIYRDVLRAALGTMSDCCAACVALGDFVTVADVGEEPAIIGAAHYAKWRRGARC